MEHFRRWEQRRREFEAEIEELNRDAATRGEPLIILRKPKIHTTERVFSDSELDGVLNETEMLHKQQMDDEPLFAKLFEDTHDWTFEKLVELHTLTLRAVKIEERFDEIYYGEAQSAPLPDEKAQQYRELFEDQVSSGRYTFSVDAFLEEYGLTEVQFLPIAIEVLKEAARKASDTGAESNPDENETYASETHASETPVSETEVEKMEDLLKWAGIKFTEWGPWSGGHRWTLETCYFDSKHRSVWIGVNALGELFYNCAHDACRNNLWPKFIALVRSRHTGDERFQRLLDEEKKREEPDLPETAQDFPPFPVLSGVLHDLALAIAPSLAYPQKALALLTAIGLSLSGRVRLKSDPWLQPRLYSVSISPAGQTKSAADKEVRRTLKPEPISTTVEDFETDVPQRRDFDDNLDYWKALQAHSDRNPKQDQRKLGEPLYPHPPLEAFNASVEFSVNSGPALVQLFSESSRVYLVPDEIAGMFEKARSTSSSPNTMFNELLRLYEGNETGRTVVARRGEKGTHLKITDAHLSLFGGATPQSFEKMWRGTGGDGAGLQSRFTLAYSDCPLPAFQTLTDPEELKRLMPRLNTLLRSVPSILPITGAAKNLAAAWVEKQTNGVPARALDTAKRVAMILASTLDAHCIDAKVMQWALDFADYQIALKKRLMPADAENNVQAFENRIIAVFENNDGVTLSQIRRAVHPERYAGGFDAYNRAVNALVRSGRIVVSGKTASGTHKYKLE